MKEKQKSKNGNIQYNNNGGSKDTISNELISELEDEVRKLET